ncbi:MAG TPA: hypothetical protein VFS63_17090 [Pseudolabrys sp.]|nr:hypothetical protein [Pseudolabrys sp.]
MSAQDTMPRTTGAIEQAKRRPSIPLSLRANHALLVVFTTLWTVAYYVVYFRNPAYLWLIAIAIALDAVRLSPTASSRLYAIIVANRYAILGAIAALFTLHCWLVVSDTFPEVAFGLPYDHYRTVLETVSKFHAAIIYCLEAAGALASFLIIADCGIRYAALPPPERTNKILEKINSRTEIHRLIISFPVFYALQLSVVFIKIGDRFHPSIYDYRPEQDPYQLLMFFASPIFFALVMKYWLQEVTRYLIAQIPVRGP